MLQTESTFIGDREWSVTQFAGQTSFDVMIDISKLVGPALAAASKGIDPSKDMMSQDMDISGIISALMGTLDKESFKHLVRRLLSSTHVDIDGKICSANDVFDQVFTGRSIWQLPKVLAFVIKVNYGDFSELAGSITALRGGPQASKPEQES